MEEKTDRTAEKAGKKKPTYEELNNYCTQLYSQNRELVTRLRQTEMGNLFKRLDYLFTVLRSKDCFDKDFVLKCAEEIKDALTVPDDEDKKGGQDGKLAQAEQCH